MADRIRINYENLIFSATPIYTLICSRDRHDTLDPMTYGRASANARTIDDRNT